MIYSRYFSALTSENGQPNLNPDQFRRMMNIVFCEGILTGLKKIKEKYKDTPFYNTFDTIIFKQDTLLTKLTGNLKPKDLVREMYMLSEA